MTGRSIKLTDALNEYLVSHSLREHPVLSKLRAETAKLDDANMQIAPEQGSLMGLLVEIAGVRRCIEIGVFTGYSTLVTALALPKDGTIIACDISKEWTDIARGFWRQAGVEDKIDLRLGPALDTLDKLIADDQSERFDYVFIDADKTGYDDYYERALTLLHPGGLIIFDNVLWDGKVTDPTDQSPDTCAIRALNDKILGDDRVTMSIVPIGDGLTLARKKEGTG